MGKCKDCKWWKRVNARSMFGICNNPEVGLEIDFRAIMITGVKLLFKYSFGCIHFERKTSLEDSIEELGLSILPLRALKSSGIKKVGDLVGKTVQELLKTRKFGDRSLLKIESQLQEYNLVERRDEDGCIHFERRGK